MLDTSVQDRETLLCFVTVKLEADVMEKQYFRGKQRCPKKIDGNKETVNEDKPQKDQQEIAFGDDY